MPIFILIKCIFISSVFLTFFFRIRITIEELEMKNSWKSRTKMKINNNKENKQIKNIMKKI